MRQQRARSIHATNRMGIKITKPSAFLALCFLAAGCATPEQIEAQHQMQEEADNETCLSYGLRPGSEAFGMCRLELDLVRQRQYDDYRHHTHYYGGYGPRHGYGAGIGIGF